MPDQQSDDSNDTTDSGEKKRRLLGGIGGVGLAAGLAGCADEEEPEPEDDGEEQDDGEEEEEEEQEEEEEEEEEQEETLTGDAASWHRDHDWDADAAAATDWDNYEVTELQPVEDLMSIDVADDGRVFYVNRGANFVTHGDATAEVGFVDPDTGDHEIVLELDVIVSGQDVADPGDADIARELGGQGVALDPDFEENGYVYVYYHPSSEDQEVIENPYHEDIHTAYQRVSRFEMDGDELDPDSEEIVINIPHQQTNCCHHGGNLQFDSHGNLYITTGDNSNNVGNPDAEIDWFMGDEREGYVHGRPAAVSDAQRTSGNTADLRGKVLRITPTEDGGYEIPDGNLKEEYEAEVGESFDDDEFHPELYVMGLRNPYIVNIDEHTGNLFIADYGNDAGSWDTNQGPVGLATYFMFDEPGNAGWPFFKGYYPYRNRDYETGEPGQPFWQDNLRNRSRNNTGIENIPNITPAMVWHPQSSDGYTDAPAWVDMPRPGEVTWPDMPDGGSANAGPAYRYRESFGEGALDPYFEGKQFLMCPYGAGGWIGYFTYGDDGSIEINEFLPDEDWDAPTDMVVLPDGRLVLMEYGAWAGAEGKLTLIEYDA